MIGKANPATLTCLILILLLGGVFCPIGFDWDEGQHLHPDERFLTMVETSLTWPESFSEYFDESKSGLNPRNVGHDFFPYGTLPTTLVKGVSILLGLTGYSEVYLLGRAVSSACFVGSILLLFFLSRLLYRDDRVALLAAFLFSTCVLAIQTAHFFTVDSFCMFFILAATYWLVRAQQSGRWWDFLLTGVFFGMALASKVSVFTFAVPVVAVVVARVVETTRSIARKPVETDSQLPVGAGFKPAPWSLDGAGFKPAPTRLLLLTAFAAFLLFRLCQPDAFRGPGFFGLQPSPRWLANMEQARLLMNGDVDYPPGHQWANRTALWFPWKNLVVWGMGLPLGIAAWLGWATAAFVLVWKRKTAHLVPVVWIGALFLHQGTQWVKSMRYFLPIYPMLALLAGWWLVGLWDRSREWARAQVDDFPLDRIRQRLAAGLVLFVPVGTLLWATAFASVYLRPHTRIEASRWIRANIPAGSVLACEHWDDALPLAGNHNESQDRTYETVQLEWYAEDTPEKLEQCLDRLENADYVILSSNRLCDSIPRLPMRYPMTVAYYESLFDGTLGFERVAEFSSRPSILGIEFTDRSAEEAFTVYDHPCVQIFKKTDAYSRENANVLLGSVDWDRIVRVTAKEASRFSFPPEPGAGWAGLPQRETQADLPTPTVGPTPLTPLPTPSATLGPTVGPTDIPTRASHPDLNKDQVVNPFDLLALLSYLVSDGINPYGVTIEDADVDGDGTVDKNDLLEFSRFWQSAQNQ